MTQDKIIKRTVLKWGSSVGIVSMAKQMKLADMLIAALNEAAEQSVQRTLLESERKFAPESVNPYPCDTN
jgi:hypothetical protein